MSYQGIFEERGCLFIRLKYFAKEKNVERDFSKINKKYPDCFCPKHLWIFFLHQSMHPAPCFMTPVLHGHCRLDRSKAYSLNPDFLSPTVPSYSSFQSGFLEDKVQFQLRKHLFMNILKYMDMWPTFQNTMLKVVQGFTDWFMISLLAWRLVMLKNNTEISSNRSS